jgi:hypothetical protein
VTSEREFSSEGVKVKVGNQKSGKRVKIVKFNKKKKSELPATAGVFNPGRIVINVGAVDQDDESQVITTFDPPMELRIKYTPADQARASAAGESLSLGFYNEDLGRWIKFTQQKHKFRLEPNANGQGGVGIVEISHWGDPNVAWQP